MKNLQCSNLISIGIFQQAEELYGTVDFFGSSAALTGKEKSFVSAGFTRHNLLTLRG